LRGAKTSAKGLRRRNRPSYGYPVRQTGGHTRPPLGRTTRDGGRDAGALSHSSWPHAVALRCHVCVASKRCDPFAARLRATGVVFVAHGATLRGGAAGLVW